MLGDRRRERDDVVLGGLFDGRDARHVELRSLFDVACGVFGDDAGGRHRFCSRDFYLEPGLESPLLAPDAAHVGVGIPADHLN